MKRLARTAFGLKFKVGNGLQSHDFYNALLYIAEREFKSADELDPIWYLIICMMINFEKKGGSFVRLPSLRLIWWLPMPTNLIFATFEFVRSDCFAASILDSLEEVFSTIHMQTITCLQTIAKFAEKLKNERPSTRSRKSPSHSGTRKKTDNGPTAICVEIYLFSISLNRCRNTWFARLVGPSKASKGLRKRIFRKISEKQQLTISNNTKSQRAFNHR